jgi:hypothetical protein
MCSYGDYHEIEKIRKYDKQDQQGKAAFNERKTFNVTQ